MPTKKGKSKPAKARKTSNKMRRSRTGGAIGKSRRAGTTARTRKKRPATGMQRTEAGPVWIGSSPAPVARPAEDLGAKKVGDEGSDRVVIL
jgi:hypothetical protein